MLGIIQGNFHRECVNRSLRLRYMATTTTNNIESLQQFMHGRRNMERRDSVTVQILMERKEHQERLQSIDVSPQLVKSVLAIGLGSKRRKHIVYQTRLGSVDVNGKPLTGSGAIANQNQFLHSIKLRAACYKFSSQFFN